MYRSAVPNAMDFLTRHVRGDLSKEDKDENQLSLEKGFRLTQQFRSHVPP